MPKSSDAVAIALRRAQCSMKAFTAATQTSNMSNGSKARTAPDGTSVGKATHLTKTGITVCHTNKNVGGAELIIRFALPFTRFSLREPHFLVNAETVQDSEEGAENLAKINGIVVLASQSPWSTMMFCLASKE